MATTREIKRFNDLLGSELGRNPYGEPVYRWENSEHVLRRKVVCNGLKPAERWVDRPVLDERGEPTGKTLAVREQIVAAEKAWPWLDHQWVVTKWCFTPYEEWNAAFGTLLDWPERGYYHPTNAELEAGQSPTVAITQEFIGLMRKELGRTFSDYMEQSESGLDRWDKANESQIEDIIADATTAFGNIPGTRSGGVSLPSPEFRKQYDAVQDRT